jgi:hypothetical protein
MADNKAIEQHLTKMTVLGGRFQLGGLYDYRNDYALPGNQLNFINVHVCSLSVLLLLHILTG